MEKVGEKVSFVHSLFTSFEPRQTFAANKPFSLYFIGRLRTVGAEIRYSVLRYNIILIEFQ